MTVSSSLSPTLSIVCPIYNEVDSLRGLFARVLPVLKATRETCNILCINDRSQDDTLKSESVLL